MDENKNHIDVWTVGVLLLWQIIFLMGLFPETVFSVLRDMGYVVTVRALINSHWFITLACAGFLGWFTYSRCAECGDNPDIALGKSVQIIILGITAFLPLRLERISMYFAIPDDIAFYRYLILSVIAVKALAWLYLATLLLRYYLISGHAVFKGIPMVFPSAFFLQEDDADKGEPRQ